MSAIHTCLDCIHWSFDGGHPDWSDITPGDNAEMHCLKGHYYHDLVKIDQEELVKIMRQADQCPDFVERPS